MVREQVDEHAAQRARRRVRWSGVLLVIGALLLYGVTLDNGLQPGELIGGDLITHQYAQVQARPSNAPGYPLYTMGGWFWFHGIRTFLLRFGEGLPNPIPILSSYSTLWALIALWLLYRILCYVTRSPQHPAGIWPVALLLSAYYGVTYFFWYYATTTEQYSSAIAQTLAILYLYLLWQERHSNFTVPGSKYTATLSTQSPITNSSSPQHPRRAHQMLLLLALLCGISLAHMLTVAFIVPPLVLVVLWQAPHLLRNVRIILMAMGAALLPLVSYLYIYLRGAAHPEWWGSGHWSTGREWFWAFVSTSQGREELGWGFEPWCTTFANGFPALIGSELSWPVVLLGVVGIALLKQKLAPLLYGTLAIYLVFAWAYRCGNWFQVILPAYPLLLIGLSQWVVLLVSAVQNAQLHSRSPNKRLRPLPLILLYTLLAVGVLVRGVHSWPRADSRNRATDTAFDRAALLLAAPLPAQSRLFAAVEDALALQYLIQIWRVRPDLAVVSSPAAAAQVAVGEAIYSTWDAASTLHAELPETLAYTRLATGPRWIRFQPVSDPVPLPVLDQQPATEILPGLLLHGYALYKEGEHKREGEHTGVDALPLAAYRPVIDMQGQGVGVTLVWQLTDQNWPEGSSISVRPTAGGVPIVGMQEDRTLPARGLSEPQQGFWVDPYFFSFYQEEAMSIDPQQIDGLMVIVYRQVGEGFENVAVLQFSGR